MDPVRDSFEALHRLLALKRHEQPPLGYFDDLRERVLDRLALEEDADPEDWFEALIERFRLRPALVGFFSFALGTFYLAGLGYSGRLAQPPHRTPWHVQKTGGFEWRLSLGGEPWPPTVVAREMRTPSIAPVIQAGPPASVLPVPHPYLPENVSPVGYVVPSR